MQGAPVKAVYRKLCISAMVAGILAKLHRLRTRALTQHNTADFIEQPTWFN